MISFNQKNLPSIDTINAVSKEMQSILNLAGLVITHEVVKSNVPKKANKANTQLYIVSAITPAKRVKRVTLISFEEAARKNHYAALQIKKGTTIDIYIGVLASNHLIGKGAHHLHINQAALGYQKEPL
jgi:hypothetical protein